MSSPGGPAMCEMSICGRCAREGMSPGFTTFAVGTGTFWLNGVGRVDGLIVGSCRVSFTACRALYLAVLRLRIRLAVLRERVLTATGRRGRRTSAVKAAENCGVRSGPYSRTLHGFYVAHSLHGFGVARLVQGRIRMLSQQERLSGV